MNLSNVNSTWCEECNQHKVKCICNPIQNIYLVEYKMIIESGLFPAWCQEKVRVIAYDEFLAISLVNDWLKTTDTIWWAEGDSITEYSVPKGGRDISIVKTEIYAKNVGELLKLYPLPEIFSHEE